MRFTATVQLDGKTATGIVVPPERMAELGGGGRPAVVVTVRGHSYRSTIGTMKGVAKIPVSAENREAAGIRAGDEVEFDVVLDDSPRRVEMPDDLAAAMAGDSAAESFYESLSTTNKQLFINWIESAKKPATRQHRLTETVAKLRAGEKLRRSR